MSLVDLHIELGNANYIAEIAVELTEVIEKKKKILTEMEKRKLDPKDMPEKEKNYFNDLEKKENELILELAKQKKWLKLDDDVVELFENELKKSKGSN